MRYQGAIPDFPVEPNSDHNVDQLQVGSGSTAHAQTQTQETKIINYELLLKWGQKKRSRISRTSSGDESGSSSRRNLKIQKRAAAVAGAEKFAASASEMPPPTNLKARLHSNGTRYDRRLSWRFISGEVTTSTKFEGLEAITSDFFASYSKFPEISLLGQRRDIAPKKH